MKWEGKFYRMIPKSSCLFLVCALDPSIDTIACPDDTSASFHSPNLFGVCPFSVSVLSCSVLFCSGTNVSLASSDSPFWTSHLLRSLSSLPSFVTDTTSTLQTPHLQTPLLLILDLRIGVLVSGSRHRHHEGLASCLPEPRQDSGSEIKIKGSELEPFLPGTKQDIILKDHDRNDRVTGRCHEGSQEPRSRSDHVTAERRRSCFHLQAPSSQEADRCPASQQKMDSPHPASLDDTESHLVRLLSG